MSVILKGSSASALTAGILLLSRARGFGQRITVEIVGRPEEMTPVEGPAIFHSAVLAGCGVGRTLGSGALIIVPGPPTSPLAVSHSQNGAEGWFLVDRSGGGLHPATRQFVSLCRMRSAQGRELGRQMRVALSALGCSPEPAVLDLLLASPAPPTVRLALALRAGRAMSGRIGTPLTHYLTTDGLSEPLPETLEEISAALTPERTSALLDRIRLSARDEVEEWVSGMRELGTEHEHLLFVLAELFSHVTSLPLQGMLAPLPPSMDAVAVGLGAALGATGGARDAMAELADVFRFLGGRFTDSAEHPIQLSDEPPPADRLERWAWFARSARRSADDAEALWRRVVDPVQ